MSIQLDLAPAVAVVTGGGSGIGEGIATTLAEAGATVAVADVSSGSASRVAEQITSKGGSALGVAMDIGDEASVQAGFETVRTRLGPVSILVNNAGAWAIKPFADTGSDEARQVVDVTLNGTMSVLRTALPDLIETQGRVITVASDSARTGENSMSVYGAAKAGLIGLTKSVAKEVGRWGVTLNVVSPGTTYTPGSASFVDKVGADKLARAYPLGRLGEPADIAGAVLFFASPLASWITGQTLSVSGGYTMV